MDPTGQIFDFELDFSGALYCIPMSTRMKLDYCGVKLSLKQWNRFTREQREELLQEPCDSAESARSFRDHVVHLIETEANDKAELLPPDDGAGEWNDPNRIPARIDAHTRNLGLPAISPERWHALPPVQRLKARVSAPASFPFPARNSSSISRRLTARKSSATRRSRSPSKPPFAKAGMRSSVRKAPSSA